MAENPDNKDYIGLGIQQMMVVKDAETGEEVGLKMEQRFLVPQQGMLRFVEKEIDNHGTPALARVLQQYQWSSEQGQFDWYDIPLVEL